MPKLSGSRDGRPVAKIAEGDTALDSSAEGDSLLVCWAEGDTVLTSPPTGTAPRRLQGMQDSLSRRRILGVPAISDAEALGARDRRPVARIAEGDTALGSSAEGDSLLVCWSAGLLGGRGHCLDLAFNRNGPTAASRKAGQPETSPHSRRPCDDRCRSNPVPATDVQSPRSQKGTLLWIPQREGDSLLACWADGDIH